LKHDVKKSAKKQGKNRLKHTYVADLCGKGLEPPQEKKNSMVIKIAKNQLLLLFFDIKKLLKQRVITAKTQIKHFWRFLGKTPLSNLYQQLFNRYKNFLEKHTGKILKFLPKNMYMVSSKKIYRIFCD
jgi:hypothetical protein